MTAVHAEHFFNLYINFPKKQQTKENYFYTRCYGILFQMAEQNESNANQALSKAEMGERLKVEIRKGFATQKFRTGSPRSKKFSGAFWKHGILQVYVGNTDEIVKNAYYCQSCDEIIITNAQGGTAPLNRHVGDHKNAKHKISRQHIAELLVCGFRLGTRYQQEPSEEYVLENLPKIKEKEW